MEPVIVIIIFVAIAIFKKVLSKGDTTDADFDKGSPPFTTERPVRRLNADQTEEERLRKFMEALGVPAGSPIPPRKIERPQQPVRRVRPQVRIETPQQAAARNLVPPPPLPQQPVETPAYAEPASPVTQTEAPVSYANASSIPSGESVVSKKNPTPLPAATKPAPAVDFRALLRTPTSIRTAFVLKEILGQPRSLQSVSDAPSFP